MDTPKQIRFDHEKLKVYHCSLKFITWLTTILDRIPTKAAVQAQLDRASTSIPLNIAEGNGRYTGADRCRFFDIARGSALECAAALDMAVAKGFIPEGDIDAGKSDLCEIVSMLTGLIRSNSGDRMYDEKVSYSVASASHGE